MNTCEAQPPRSAAIPAAATEAATHAAQADAWLARVAHEMRTPLTAILGYAQLLQMDCAPGTPQSQAAQMIRSAGQHLLGLAADLLDHGSLQAGRFTLNAQPFPLGRLIDDVANLVRIPAGHKGLTVQRAAALPLPHWLIGDEARLRQVLLNLMANAVQFTRHGGITLHVRGQVLDRTRWRLRFEVRDTGIGLSADEITRLFSPYGRLKPGAAMAPGTGLGLSISREIVRAMGSDIEVTSLPGGGSCFAFALDAEALAEG